MSRDQTMTITTETNGKVLLVSRGQALTNHLVRPDSSDVASPR